MQTSSAVTPVADARRCEYVTAAVAFGETSRILKIRPEWLQQILVGQKTTEIRGARCPHSGWVSIASTGERMIRCRARLGASRLLSAEEMVEHEVAVKAMGYKQSWAWPIEDVELVEPPIAIPPRVAQGAAQWTARTRSSGSPATVGNSASAARVRRGGTATVG